MATRGDTAGGAGTSPGRTDGREALRMLSDKPLKDDADDRLGFAAYADALAELLDHPDTDTPLTIAISAQWGAGKTSLAKMVERRLKHRPIERGDPSHITCWFNAWMHDDAPHLGAAFAAEVAKRADRNRPMWRRLIFPLPSAMLSPEQRWGRRLRIAIAAFIVALVITLQPDTGRVLRQVFAPKAEVADQLRDVFGGGAGAAILVFAVFAFWRSVFTLGQAAARFVDDPKSEAAKGSMQNVSVQLGQLIGQATHVRPRWLVLPRAARRFVIFVDDLERCRPPRAVDVCEVASQLLGHPNVIIVLIADMATIATSAEIKYSQLDSVRADGAKDSAEGSPSGVYGRLFLQKIVQIQFNLPVSPAASMPGLLTETVRPPPPIRPFRGPLKEIRREIAIRQLEFSTRERHRRPPIHPDAPDLARPGQAPFSLVLAIVFWWVWRTDPTGMPNWGAALILLGLGVGFVWGLWSLFWYLRADYRDILAKQAQSQIDRAIRQAMNTGAATVEEVMEALIGTGLEPKRQELARQRAQRMLADESARRMQAESEIKEHLPALPRSAKRLFNHLRVLLMIAEQKQMFGGEPELQAKHLGKWAVLLERWPELGSALTTDPRRLGELEAATSTDELSTQLGPILLTSTVAQDLLAFLKSPTKLAPFVERLVYFQPALPKEVAKASSDEQVKVTKSTSPRRI